jgi:hypothetical protein
MAYYIFLKSLRSLEEFRKNPHVKISPKSPSTNFQSLVKFKNLIFNSEILFLAFGPVDPAARLASGPARPPTALSPQTEIRFPFRIMPSRAGRLSLVSLSIEPHLSNSPPSPRRPTRLEIPRAAAPPRHYLAPRMPPELLQPSLITLPP